MSYFVGLAVFSVLLGISDNLKLDKLFGKLLPVPEEDDYDV